MRKLLLITGIISGLLSCGSSKSGKQVAEDICDCYKKANALPATDPSRSSAQQECLTQQGEAWNKVKGDAKKADEFNKTISDCGKEQIQNSLK